MKKLPLLLAAALFSSSALFADIAARGTSVYRDKKTGLVLAVGEIDELDARWHTEEPPATAPIRQVVWIPFDRAKDDDEDIPSIVPSDQKKPRRFVALLRDDSADEATFTLRRPDSMGGASETVRWNLADAKKNPTDNADLFHQWAEIRAYQWAALTPPDASNLLVDLWESKLKSIYGAETFFRPERGGWGRRNRDNSADRMGSLAVFGGQAAIRETLQTQVIRARNSRTKKADKDTSLVDVSSIAGVEVEAHPYAEMLASLNPGEPTFSLADYAPIDRFFLSVREPRKVAALLDGADDTAARLTPLLGEGFADYALLARYTAKFGLTPDQARTWFSGGNVAELALITPDVFFRDNTDLTFVIRLKPNATTPFKLAKKIPGVLSVPLPDGSAFHLASRDNLLFLSTNKAELDGVLALAGKNGAGSLGRSDEFCVMTHKLPQGDNTGVYVYFSDPFIRRLTGPEIKIGQFRRATARGDMEHLAAVALLYRLDHGVDAADVAELKARGYLEEGEIKESDLTLEKGCRVVSKEWGTLEQIKTLTQNPAKLATSDEQTAYNEYRERYTQFWRQYFDPIAVRLDLKQDGKIALETFILPLIDNSLYTGIKESIGAISPTELKLPEYRDPAIATLAFKIPKDKNTSRMLRDVDFLNHTALLSLLDDTVVLSVRDSAPVVQANFPGISSFGVRSSLIGMRGEEMLVVPVFAAMITRPCDLAVRVSDEKAALGILRSLYSQRESWSAREAVFIEDENKLIFAWTVEGVLRLEFGATVENGWLHITNHPWTPTPIVGTQSSGASSHARVVLTPSELKLGLPQALSIAQSAYRTSVYASASELLPWMQAYGVDADAALKIQGKALGRMTPVPKEVTLSAKDGTYVKPYGSWTYQGMKNSKVEDTGILRGIQNVNLWLRFEDDGLRTSAEFSPQN
ncbi:MAG: hypothetical protein LBV12_07820 [Puniceicoccales bacterium]|nr:hypothetical protein [Puniceicoccales bacterium]